MSSERYHHAAMKNITAIQSFLLFQHRLYTKKSILTALKRKNFEQNENTNTLDLPLKLTNIKFHLLMCLPLTGKLSLLLS